MYSYLRGLYKGHAPDNEEAIIVEATGIGYEVFVPPIVDQEVSATYQLDDGLVLHVSAQSGRDQPWPVLFGFLTARQKSFWQLLISVPRVGGAMTPCPRTTARRPTGSATAQPVRTSPGSMPNARMAGP